MEYSLFENRVVELLKNEGLIENTDLPPGRIWFDADTAHEVLLSAKNLTGVEARTRLGVTESAMQGILRAGLLSRVETPRFESEGRRTGRPLLRSSRPGEYVYDWKKTRSDHIQCEFVESSPI
ncbi:hypothetical protein [Rhizobium leguminosarum]|uniref:hypothetical protein n=1 Tax=Rhizobium leguminosarum TaxID=384 RepID=UPI003F9E9594